MPAQPVSGGATPPPARLIAHDLFGPDFECIDRYVDILSSRAVERGLVGPREVDRLWERHILNSVALADLVPHGSEVVDVGSGAGLPGVALAILRPDLAVTLLEPLLRRSTFLDETVDELGLGDRVRVVRGRAEDHIEDYDAVVARAVAPLDRLAAWCAPLRRSDGVVLALKGRAAHEELDQAASTLARLHLAGEILSVRAHPQAEATSVVRLRGGR